MHGIETQLDALLGELRFTNPALLERIAEQLKRLDAQLETVEVQPPDPRITKLRAAIANLSDDSFAEMRKAIGRPAIHD
jgi:hypothetical protein